MTTDSFVGVVLAAGHGTRMLPFSEMLPKPLLPVANETLIEKHIKCMKSLGITEILILIGHKGYEIARVLGDGSRLGVKIRYVEQTERLGIAHAVGTLEPYIDKPFLLILGDIFFRASDLGRMFRIFSEQHGGAVLAAKVEDDPLAIQKNFSITLSDDGFVTRVIEKPRYTTNKLKGVGVYLFDMTVFDAIRQTPRTAMRDEYEITHTIQVMIDNGSPVRVADAILHDVNITSPADLLRCNLGELGRLSASSLVGADASIHKGVQLVDSVVGSNVAITEPIAMKRCLVLDETRIESPSGFDGFILTPQFKIDCRHELDSPD